ncbi:ICAM3 isoform 7 [Pongo abelii]|uniref:ICAM3 isoform 7 n=1 Tax=Pongo abelii TaxID=9601 RepID=A0A2J8S137_PONAB|nr:ICAM3 isoform 7 [Pongo abelii]
MATLVPSVSWPGACWTLLVCCLLTPVLIVPALRKLPWRRPYQRSWWTMAWAGQPSTSAT